MEFDPPLIPGRLLRRYQRFLADVVLEDGRRVTAHCPNTGAMTGCAEPGMKVWLSRSDKPGRKYPFGWELVEAAPGVRVGVHTGRANRLVAEAAGSLLPELAGFRLIAEAGLPDGRSRADFRLEGPAQGWLEVKSVTAAVSEGVGLFPDAVTLRGRRHLDVLGALAAAGVPCFLVFCVQRPDVDEVRPADLIDPGYGRALREAIGQGLAVVALGAEVTPEGIRLVRRLPVVCP